MSMPAEEIAFASLAELQAGLESGRWSSRTLCGAFLQRIDALDLGEPALRSVLETNPDALEMADELDRERKENGPRGPLHGIPILLKDNIATHDRMTTTAGSLALEGYVAPWDAKVAARLRRAGAILLGKTNLSEWANFRSPRSSSGWSGRGGQCRNPYVLDRTPSGSSSGSAVAVAAGLCAAAIGTETDGSIVSPSSANSVVGIKPTVGLVSRFGIAPIAHSQDTAGPMARSVADAALLLEALAGSDARDSATADAPQPGPYTAALRSDALQGARIGVAREGVFGRRPAADRLIEEALEVMRRCGAKIIDPADIATVAQFGRAEHEVLLYEFKADLNAFLRSLGADAPVHSLADVIAFNQAHAEREMPYFGQETMERAQARGPLTESAYRRALETARRLARDEGLDATLSKHRLDAIVTPTAGPPTPIDLVNGDGGMSGSSSPAAVAGYPSITVPAGYVHGLPVGISFTGAAYSEARLIALAYAYEQASRVWRAPRYLPTVAL